MIFAIVALLLVNLFIAIHSYKYYWYNWDKKVNEYITQYNCEFEYIRFYQQDTTKVYKYQTRDENQIEFEVKCSWNKIVTPFGFSLPIKKAYITDDFSDQICEYISLCDGAYNIEGKSIEQISSYVFDTMSSCEDLMSQYGIEALTPHISFTFIDSDKEYEFEWANYNENILRDRLTELLY